MHPSADRKGGSSEHRYVERIGPLRDPQRVGHRVAEVLVGVQRHRTAGLGRCNLIVGVATTKLCRR